MVGSGVRQLMHRLVVCLDGRSLMPLLPPASQALLHTPSPTILTEYLPLINQTITKFQVLKGSHYLMVFFMFIYCLYVIFCDLLKKNIFFSSFSPLCRRRSVHFCRASLSHLCLQSSQPSQNPLKRMMRKRGERGDYSNGITTSS